MTIPTNATELLHASQAGNTAAAEELRPVLYEELRIRAARHLRGERVGHTWQTSDLLHEAYAQLIDGERVDPQGRTHFRALACRIMRQLLVQHAREHRAQKRGGGRHRLTLDEALIPAAGREVDLLDLDAALQELEQVSPRQCQVVELRFFAGLSEAETAAELKVSDRTVRREWVGARAWLHRKLQADTGA